ncbi:uncharacterized protein TNCV_3193561 [Trichonephila clavipes]|nr:uncharacterized protein TNCV_3193561 [Trichonephila clavipes]
MLARNVKNTKKRISTADRGHVIGQRKGRFSFHAITERLGRNISPVGSSGQGMVLPQEDRVSSGHVALLRGKIKVLGVRLWRIVLWLRQKFEMQLIPRWHNVLLEIGYFKGSSCNPSGVKSEHTRRVEWRYTVL